MQLLAVDVAFWSMVAAGTYVLALATATHAILTARTSQASIAWTIGLIAFPYLSLPMYWIFGRSKFLGYVLARRVQYADVQEELNRLDHKWDKHPPTLTETGVRLKPLEKLASSPWTGGNRAELLINDKQIFDGMFEMIDWAKDYVLIQFYILRDDDVGRELTDRLVAAAQRGVQVFLLWDEFGCRPEPTEMFRRLHEAGAKTAGFKPNQGGIRNLFRINFRNHRKLVLVDGKVACIGGANVGDEYMGRSKKFGFWRDTQLRLWGPCVEAIQLAWAEDWHWATTGEVPEVIRWEPQAAPNSDQTVLVLPTGPADPLESCDLLFVKALQEARKRIWIASPYFVPDPQTKAAMQLAALRGVDVRFLIPDAVDHKLVWYAAWNYFEQAQKAGVRIFRYRGGFMHQKVILIDDDVASVGTANFDNRSFRLNFELMALINDEKFAGEVEAMLLADFEKCFELEPFKLEDRAFF
ncbi:MAG: cardiolipin synthase, partial [Planctomycetota bacterium]